ncbi:MAG: hypothetical protein IKA88_06435 [Clostridia bacterium]|nr:hypothetical protein [Clostridia bacterium]
MSNINQLPTEEMPEDFSALPPVEETETLDPTAKKKNAGYRVFAAILAVISVAAFFIPMFGYLNAFFAVEEEMLFKVLTDAFGSDMKAFGVIPVLTNTELLLGKLAGVMLYVLVAGLAVSFILSFIALFSAKKAPALLAAAATFFGVSTAAYTVSIIAATASIDLKIDLISVALAAVGVLLCCLLSPIRNGKKAWANVFQFLLTIGACFSVVYGAGKAAPVLEIAYIVKSMYETIVLAIVAVVFLCAVFAYIRLRTVKGLGFDIFRYVLLILAAVALCYVNVASEADSDTLQLYALIAAIISVVQIIIAIVQIRCKGKKEVKDAQEEILNSFEVEEYAEAYPYEGGPVAGVEMAEEVNTTVHAQPAPVQTAGYDFYNCKSFDPFIASLDMEERNQFTELFILKYKGVMPEIPDYQVGGDNKEFFRKVFIYLGQYRDRIPNGLLAKIYQFSIKLS